MEFFRYIFLPVVGGEPMINDVQKEAIRRLSDLAVRGNEQAREALKKLWYKADYHILLREMVGATLGKQASPNV
jgi:hypothetical protein